MKSTYTAGPSRRSGDRFACDVTIHYDPPPRGDLKEEVLYTVWGSSPAGARLRAERLLDRVAHLPETLVYAWTGPTPTHCEITKKPITDCFVDAVTTVGLNRRLVHPDAMGMCLTGTWWRLVGGRWIHAVSP